MGNNAINTVLGEIVEFVSAMSPAKMTIEDMARACHTGNLMFCQQYSHDSLANWDDVKGSAVDGVKAFLKDGLNPEQMHENWLKFKAAEGWVYGLEKDFDKKTHPCMVPSDQLPVIQQYKDDLFLKIVTTLKPRLATDLYESKADERQEGDIKVSLFRPRYRALNPEEVQLHDAIKSKADELAELIFKIKETPNTEYAIRHLEDAVYRAVKGLTS